MRKISLLLVVLMLFSIVGCSNKNGSLGNSDKSGSSQSSSKGNSKGSGSNYTGLPGENPQGGQGDGNNSEGGNASTGWNGNNSSSKSGGSTSSGSTSSYIPTPSTPSAYAKILYVATSGNDTSGDGSLSKPYKTIAKAATMAKSYTSGGAVKISIRGGTYLFTSSLSLNSTNSGKSKTQPVIYEAYNNEKVVVTGAKEFTGSSFVSADSSIKNKLMDSTAKSQLIQVNLSGVGVTDLGTLIRRGYYKNNGGGVVQAQLYIDGNRQQLARWPNVGKTIFDKITSNGTATQENPGSGVGPTYNVANHYSRFSSWQHNRSDIWIDGILTRDWAWTYNKIAAFNDTNKTIQLAYGDCGGDYNTWCATLGWYYENILEEIDMPGEYYIDRNTKMLYLYPPAGFGASSKIEIPQFTGNLLNISGAKFVEFRGIAFEHTRGDAISVASDDVVLDKIEVGNIGGTGVVVDGYRNVVSNSYIHNTGSTGVWLKGGDTIKLTPTNNSIENCVIDGIGEIRKVYQPSIDLGGVGQIVKYNLIKNAPHMGVQVRGNDHQILNNEFYNMSTEFADMGIIYMNLGNGAWQRGTLIQGNYFHDYEAAKKVTSSGVANWGVYLDNGTMGVDVLNNVFANAQAGGIFYHGGGYNKSENNIFVNIKQPFRYSQMYSYSWAHSITKSHLNSWKSDRDSFTSISGSSRVWKSTYSAYGKYAGLLDFYTFADDLYNAVQASTVSGSYVVLASQHMQSTQLSKPNIFQNNKIWAESISTDDNVVNGVMNKTYMLIDYLNGKQGTVSGGSVDQRVSSNPGIGMVSGSGVNALYSVVNYKTATGFRTVYPRNGEAVSRLGYKTYSKGNGSTQITTKDAGVQLLWESTPHCDQYVIQIATNNSFTAGLQTYTTGRNYLALGTLTAGTYYWRVTAKTISNGSSSQVQNSDGVRSFVAQ